MPARVLVATAVLFAALALALAVPRLVAGDAPGCPSLNFSRDCAPTGAYPYPGLPQVRATAAPLP